MKELCEVIEKARKKKVYKNVEEFRNFIEVINKSDNSIQLDWDYDAGEEWARYLKSDVGIVCLINAKIGIAFIRKDELKKRTKEVLKQIFIIDVYDFDSREWCINLSLLKEMPEIIWNASPNAIDMMGMSLNDLYYATI